MDIKEESPTVINEEKHKACFNLSKVTLDNLDNGWMEIRKLSGSKQISKTMMMEVAFNLALNDFKKFGIESKYYRTLMWLIEKEPE